MAVVDDRLRVHGLAGLRVIDASVMQTVTSTNTNAPTIMIVEKGAAMIRADARNGRQRSPIRTAEQRMRELEEGRRSAQERRFAGAGPNCPF